MWMCFREPRGSRRPPARRKHRTAPPEGFQLGIKKKKVSSLSGSISEIIPGCGGVLRVCAARGVSVPPAAPLGASVPARRSQGPVLRKPGQKRAAVLGTGVTCQAQDASADGRGLHPPSFPSHHDLGEESCCSGSAWCSAAESIQRGGSRSQVPVRRLETRRWLHLGRGWSSLVWGRGWGHSGQGTSSVWSLGAWPTLCGLGNDFGKVAVAEHRCRIAPMKSEEFLQYFYTEKYLHLSLNRHLLYLK